MIVVSVKLKLYSDCNKVFVTTLELSRCAMLMLSAVDNSLLSPNSLEDARQAELVMRQGCYRQDRHDFADNCSIRNMLASENVFRTLLASRCYMPLITALSFLIEESIPYQYA